MSMVARFRTTVCGALALAAGVALVATVPLGAETIRRPAMTIDLVMPSSGVASLTERLMRDEVVRIWAREGVTVRWRASEEAVPPGGHFVRLTLIDDVTHPYRATDRYILGDFQPDEQQIRVSLAAATRTATAGTAVGRRPDQRQPLPLALGYVLGRAVAHEVGHALLGRAHTDEGLMTAAFPPSVMVDSTSLEFRLDDANASRLADATFEARVAVRDLDPDETSSDADTR